VYYGVNQDLKPHNLRFTSLLSDAAVTTSTRFLAPSSSSEAPCKPVSREPLFAHLQAWQLWEKCRLSSKSKSQIGQWQTSRLWLCTRRYLSPSAQKARKADSGRDARAVRLLGKLLTLLKRISIFAQFQERADRYLESHMSRLLALVLRTNRYI